MVAKRQNRFTNGWIDPKAVALNDYEQFYASLANATNVIGIPEGGLTLRYGLPHIAKVARKLNRVTAGITITAPNGGTTANANDGDDSTFLVTTTPVGTTNNFVVVSYDLGAGTDVKFIDIVATTLTANSSNEFQIQTSDDGIVWTQVGNNITLNQTPVTYRVNVSATTRYARLVRVGVTDLGAANVSIADFNVYTEGDISETRGIRYKFNIDQRYGFVLSDKNIAIYRNGVYQADIRAPIITDDKLGKINWTFGGDTILICHEDFDVQLIKRLGSDTLWSIETWDPDNIPYYDFVSSKTLPAATLTPSAVSGVVTLTASAASFNAGDVNQIVEGNFGKARIVAYTSTTVVSAVTIVPFANTSAIAANNWNIQRGFEPIISPTRGYPRSLCFFNQRLWIGGTKSKPRCIVGSIIGEPFDFNLGQGRDSDGIFFDLDNEEPIVNILPHRALNLFTSGAESAYIPARGLPTNNETTSFIPQTEIGSKQGLRPVVSNGVIIFVQRGANSVFSLVYDDTQQSFTASNISRLASHIIRTPVDFDIRRSNTAEEADSLLVVNSDGTMANGLFVSEEKINGFTLIETDGLIKNAFADEDEIYFIVRRTINGVEDNYFEKADSTIFLDASVKITTGLPTNTFTGLDHLEGKTVSVYADGLYLEDRVVAGGQITTEVDVEDYVHIGLPFTPTIQTLPFELMNNPYDQMGVKKRVSSVYLWLYNSMELRVNGINVTMRDYSTLVDQPLPVFTGIKRVEGLRGRDEYGQITIDQSKPLPFTLLALRLEDNS